MALTIEITVVPNSGRQHCLLDRAKRLKCYLKSPPERNKANEELIKLIASALSCAKNAVAIVAGHTTRKKRISIAGNYTYEHLLAALGITDGVQGAVY